MPYDFDELIDRKNTNSIKCAFAAEQGKPEDILPMWVADMDFRSPQGVVDALSAAVAHGVFGYPGVPKSYFSAVTDWYSSRHGWDIDPAWITPIPGVVHALAVAVQAFTKPGDGVLICRPVYHPFSHVIEDAGRRIVNSPLHIEGDRLCVDFEDFEKKAKQARMFILCSPHNPGGRVWERSELVRMAKICLENDLLIVADEIHGDFVYPGATYHPMAALSSETARRTVACTAPSKTFNIAGLCASNVIIPDADLKARFDKTLERTHSGMVNTLALIAAEAAYRTGGDWLDALLPYLWDNISLVSSLLTDIPGISLLPPQGTYLLWLDCRKMGLSQPELVSFFDNEAKVWLNDGSMFGPEGEGFMRMNIGCPHATVREAMTRIRAAYDRRMKK